MAHTHKNLYRLQVWVVSLYLLSTNLKSVSSMKLHRDLSITQKSAWHLVHRIREAMAIQENGPMSGPVEVDETYFGGKRRTMRTRQRKRLEGRGPAGKIAVVGVKDRASNTVRAKVVPNTTAETLQGFVVDNADAFATLYTDDASAYQNLPYHHESVKHSISEYVRERRTPTARSPSGAISSAPIRARSTNSHPSM